MILDTSFIIDVMQRDAKALEKLADMIKKGTPQAITTPSLFELWSGIAQSNKPLEEKKKIRDVLLGQTIFELDKESAEHAGIIDGFLIKKSEKIEPVDSMIAGIAKVNSETVLTRNTKHFEKTDVMVETY